MDESVIDSLPDLEAVENELRRKRRETRFLNSLKRLLEKRASREELMERIAQQQRREGSSCG